MLDDVVANMFIPTMTVESGDVLVTGVLRTDIVFTVHLRHGRFPISKNLTDTSLAVSLGQ